MVDIDQYRIEATTGFVGIEMTTRRGRHLEEIAMDETAAPVRRQFAADQDQAGLMPFDHFGQCINDDQRTDLLMRENRLRSVAQTETANDDIQPAAG